MNYGIKIVTNIVVRFCMELHPEAKSDMEAVIAVYNENLITMEFKKLAGIDFKEDFEFRMFLVGIMDELAGRGEVIKVNSLTNQGDNNG
jgi:hypothetical protein